MRRAAISRTVERLQENLARSARWLCILVLLGLVVRHVTRAGGFELRAPATVFSRAFLTQRAQEPLLLFLREARDQLPAGASIAVLAPGDPDSIYLLALGQLPRQRVVRLPDGEPGTAPVGLPEYAAVFGERPRDPRYRPLLPLAGGRLERRAAP